MKVEKVELRPPVHAISLDWYMWKVQSHRMIHRKGKNPVMFHLMPNGLKRRIAQTLDPTNWPPLLEED